MNKSCYDKVKKFHAAFGHKMPSSPTPMPSDLVLNRMGFLAEEVIELLHASSTDLQEFHELYCELLERMDKSFVKQSEKAFSEDVLTSQVDALVDIKYFNEGNFTLLNIDPEEPFNIVHNANMGKLWSDGKPRYNENGKFMKPDDWEERYAPEPLLKKEIQRQIEAANQ